MNVLVLSSKGKALDNSPMWRALGTQIDVELRFLDKAGQRNLRASLRHTDPQRYDRIVLDLMFKHIQAQAGFLRSLDNLVIYEEDACLNFISGSRWFGRFSPFYRKLPGVRVINTGAWVAAKLASEGVDTHFVPKGFDGARLNRQCLERDIFLGFVGRVGSAAYAQRHQLLTNLAAVEPLQLLRTQTPAEYPQLLNRIQCFVSADIGLHEYMAKNFEAMACGCLLLAKRHGEGEEQALGLVDGHNVLLYDELDDLRERIEWVRRNPDQAALVAQAGHDLAVARHEYSQLADSIRRVLEKPLNPVPAPRKPWWRRWL